MGIGDDGVEMDREVQKDDCWGSGVAVVGKFVASDCQVNTTCLSLGNIDVTDEVGVGNVITLWVWPVWR